jgi:hypothetical protein
MPGSSTTLARPSTRVGALGHVAFRSVNGVGTPGLQNFRGSMAGLYVPLSTLRRCPHEQLRMTRG